MNAAGTGALLKIVKSHGLKRSRTPEWISPQLATLAETPPPGREWIYEVKFDGYRIIVRIDRGKVRLYSRNHLDWTEKLSELATAFHSTGIQSGYFDGEIVAVDERGVSNFQLLQEKLKLQPESILIYLFDCMFLEGIDLRRVPLVERKSLLGSVVKKMKSKRILFSEDFEGEGKELWSSAAKQGLEGIMAKMRSASYVSDRTRSWLKIKVGKREEFVICGFTPHSKHPNTMIGSLLLGSVVRGTKKLRYSGKVGTGFTDQIRKDLFERCRSIATESSPLSESPLIPHREAQWTKPLLLAEISFTERTRDGLLRHPSFQGLRQDKTLKDLKASSDRQLKPLHERHHGKR